MLSGRASHDVQPGHHWLIVGQNGSGKSTLGTVLAGGYGGSLVIQDPKNDPAAVLPNCHIAESASDVIRHLPGRVVWRPGRADKRDIRAAWERICGRVMDLARAGYSLTLLCHEVTMLASDDSCGQEFSDVIMQGRSLAGDAGHVTLIAVSQRPVHIPKALRTEARHIACFTLTDEDDRAYVSKLMGDQLHPEWSAVIRKSPLPTNHTFYYRSPELRLELHDPVRVPA